MKLSITFKFDGVLELFEKSGLHSGKFSLSSDANGLLPPLLVAPEDIILLLKEWRERESEEVFREFDGELMELSLSFKFQISTFLI